ncbi:uncharacterized protein LAESUDRAFT_716405 [Laetiporus sulphureus 93-53]|uniref:Uncharacterized protein n=1 Tax=Laetiporus sulphureus 93-53 TaxID=1314785 RepID=A0A165CQI9_9APHY|nr:uncharacterized protein LAESUDRAFT_716405 [Laetiporus sulphureus 93-53]KZT03239.1 hypothetical protein LAESUDRAFT_716405 [Laetiporus sulphureus 93-53]
MSAPVALSVEDLVDENEGDENVDEEVVDEVVDEDTNTLQITAIERSGEISEDDKIDSEILATLFGDEEEGEQVELIGDNEDHSDREESMVEEVAIHPLLPVEFHDMVMDHPSGIHSKQDKDGFQRICAGVLWANKSEWAKLFEDPAWCTGMDAVEHTRDSVDVAATREVIDRLTLRSALIHRWRTITSAQTFVERFLSRIDIILWSVDYAKVDRFSRGQLFRKMFKYQYPQYFSGVSEKTAWEAVAPQYRQWSKSLHNEITGYNQMYEMFIMMHYISICIATFI